MIFARFIFGRQAHPLSIEAYRENGDGIGLSGRAGIRGHRTKRWRRLHSAGDCLSVRKAVPRLSMSPLALTIFLLVFIAFWVCWLLLVLVFPRAWEKFVDWENDFFLRRGLIPSSLGLTLKRLEKGFVLKLVLAATILLACMALAIVVGRYFLGYRI